MLISENILAMSYLDNSLFDLASVSDILNNPTSYILQIIGSFYQNQAKMIPMDVWLKWSSETE